ncbi:acetylornithine deacetylase [Psychrobacter sp. I-STPA10]|uniref:acetylornithine deacetylase n=1 Tax=Psychrobacter sp. I-STPA10 TaxID=2585769 RepID=UPI001E4F47D1|nr:acetylornithine deacetylase [Psychrobacter sp. I-STPA10]
MTTSCKEQSERQNFPMDSVAWLQYLIGFNTVSSKSNLALIEAVATFCRQLELEPILTHNKTQTKANLFVTVPASRQGKAEYNGGIVLSGHTDVVPVEGQAWSSNPFTAEVRDGKLYGRGACDMKGFIACALTLLPQAVKLADDKKLQKPLHLALSFDEEVGCLGAPLILKDLAARDITPEYCIVGEPSEMQMVVAHKGISVYRCSVHGKSVHSSLTPQGVNAISYASRLIGFIDELAQTLSARDDCDHYFDVSFSTLSVGTIQGGTATNIVPNLCEFTFDYRNLPHMGQDAIIEPIKQKIALLNQQMQAVDSNTGIELNQLEDVPAMTDAQSAELQKLVAGLVHDESVNKVAYATEGGQFTNAGIATVICGPGSIEQAHKADEFVSLEQLQRCDEFLQQLLFTMQ